MDAMYMEIEGFIHSVTRLERDKSSNIRQVQLKSCKDSKSNGNPYYNYEP